MNGARMLGTVIALVALLAGAAPNAAAAPRAPVAAPNLSPVRRRGQN
jgi:hypothetical protein